MIARIGCPPPAMTGDSRILRMRHPCLRASMILLALLLLALTVLAACDSGIRADAALGLREGERLTTEQRERLRAQLDGRVHREDRPFYGAAVAVERGAVSGEPLPHAVEGARGLTLKIPKQADIRQIATAITAATDIPVNIRTRYVLEDGVVEVPIGTRMRVDHNGALSAFLDRLAARMDIAWTYDGTVITIDRMTRATFRIALPLGVTTVTDSTQSERGPSVSTTRTLDPWTDLRTRLEPLAPPPARVTLTPEAGRVDVFGPPSVHRTITDVLADVAATANTRIGLDVAVYFVDSDKADEFGVTLGTLGNRLGAVAGRDVEGSLFFGNSVDGLTVSADDSGSLNVALAGQAGGGLVISHGSSVFSFESLARNSAVVDYRLASSIAQSGVMTPVALTEERSYIRNVTTEDADEEGNPGSVSYEIGELETGLALAALPRLIETRRIHLSLTFSQRAFRGFDPEVLARTGTVQAPTVDNREIRNQAVLSPGETLVLSGYEQDVAVRGDSGTGWFRRIGLGGKTESTRRKVRMVIMVRPSLLAARADRT